MTKMGSSAGVRASAAGTLDPGGSGTAPGAAPLSWELGRNEPLPPLMAAVLGLPVGAGIHFDRHLAAQSKTWPCVPEPLRLFAPGSAREVLRHDEQSFSLYRWSTGEAAAARAVYAVRLTAPDRAAVPVALVLSLDLMNGAGATVQRFQWDYAVGAVEERRVLFSRDIDPALYDVIAAANWRISAACE